MSTSLASRSYQVVFTPAVQGEWASLYRRERTTVNRELKALAQLAELRHWLSSEECQEPIFFRAGRYEVVAHLEPDTRTLHVTALRLRAS